MSATLSPPFFVKDLLKRPAIQNVEMVDVWIKRKMCSRPETEEIRRIRATAQFRITRPEPVILDNPLDRYLR